MSDWLLFVLSIIGIGVVTGYNLAMAAVHTSASCASHSRIFVLHLRIPPRARLYSFVINKVEMAWKRGAVAKLHDILVFIRAE